MEKTLDRLISALEAKGFKKHGRATQVARATGYSVGMVSDVLRGKAELSERFLDTVCVKIGLSKEWVQSERGKMFEPQAAAHPRGAIPINEIPVLGRISAGFPNIAAEEIIEYISIPGTPENSFALVVKGASMEPTFREGDYVLFIENGEYAAGDVLIVLDEWGDAMVKRLKEKEGKHYLVSDNPAYPTFVPNENYRIIGRVVKVWRDIKF